MNLSIEENNLGKVGAEGINNRISPNVSPNRHKSRDPFDRGFFIKPYSIISKKWTSIPTISQNITPCLSETLDGSLPNSVSDFPCGCLQIAAVNKFKAFFTNSLDSTPPLFVYISGRVVEELDVINFRCAYEKDALVGCLHRGVGDVWEMQGQCNRARDSSAS